MISCARSILLLLSISLLLNVAEAQQASSSSTPSSAIGTVAAINGKLISVKTDAGAEMSVTVSDSTRLLKTAPGQRDLKEATPISLQDVQIGDRVLARGASEGTSSITATSVIVMKQADVASRSSRISRNGKGEVQAELLKELTRQPEPSLSQPPRIRQSPYTPQTARSFCAMRLTQ